MTYQTGDINLSAYLVVNGYPIVSTDQQGPTVFFNFDIEAEELAKTWAMSPTEQMQLIQAYTQQREQLFHQIKRMKTRNYGEYR